MHLFRNSPFAYFTDRMHCPFDIIFMSTSSFGSKRTRHFKIVVLKIDLSVVNRLIWVIFLMRLIIRGDDTWSVLEMAAASCKFGGTRKIFLKKCLQCGAHCAIFKRSADRFLSPKELCSSPRVRRALQRAQLL